MIDTKHEPTNLHLYECSGKDRHRIYRKTQGNQAACSRCSGRFHYLGEFPREEGESDVMHRIRVLAYRKARVS